jgi:adenine-specific DNA-methyltransferase
LSGFEQLSILVSPHPAVLPGRFERGSVLARAEVPLGRPEVHVYLRATYIEIRPAAGGAGQLQVEIHGLDVYDPTTGVVRSDSTDDIACWFIDTAYDDAQFFVRHAYFLGADDPYDKLKRALRADIDEAAWASLNSTGSRPFARPASGRIAVKVINHYGDEILKVYGV